MRAELRGGLRAKLLRGGAVRAAGQVTAGRGGLRAMMWQKCAVRAHCGPSYCGEGRAADYDVAHFAVRAHCGPSYCGAGRAEISSPSRALVHRPSRTQQGVAA